MTAYTSTQTGLFSANSTWGGAGHPSVNGDTFTIAVGHVVTLDLDLTGLSTGLGASTVNGTLQLSQTNGSYGLKINNAALTISSTGTIDCSNGAGGALPSGVTATFTGSGASWGIIINGAYNVICGEPTYKYVKTTQSDASGQAVLHVNTNLTGDTLWAGALVRVDNINQAAQSEQYTVQSITSTTITLTANLSNTKASGAYVILVTRNVKVVGTAGTGVNLAGTTQTGIFSAEIRGFATGVNSAITSAATASATIGGSVTGTATNAINAVSNSTINASLSGGATGINAGRANTFAGIASGFSTAGLNAGLTPTLNGAVVTGCAVGLAGVQSPVCINTSIINNATGLSLCDNPILKSVTLNNNTQDLSTCSSGSAYSSSLNSATQFLNYNGISRMIFDYFESVDDGGVAGAFKAWCRGGIAVSVASPVYDASRARSYNHTPESATYYVFRQQIVLVPANGSINVRCYVQADTAMAYLPRLWVFSAGKEPFISGSPDDEKTMQVGYSLNTWYVLTSTVTNPNNAPEPYVVRTLAKNASGNFYADPIIRVNGMMQPASMEGFLVA